MPAGSGAATGSALSRNLGVEDVSIELPGTLDPLDDKDLAVAFAARWLLPLGHNGAMRARANVAEVAAQLLLQQVELNVEVELREEVGVERENRLNAGGSRERLADDNRIVRIDAPDEVKVGFVQAALISLEQVFGRLSPAAKSS